MYLSLAVERWRHVSLVSYDFYDPHFSKPKVIKSLDPPMNCAKLVFLIKVIRNTNSAQFIGGSNDLITFNPHIITCSSTNSME